MSRVYAATARRLRPLLDALEAGLPGCGDGKELSGSALKVLGARHDGTRDDWSAAAAALEDVGVLVPCGTTWFFSSAGLAASAGYRQGVRDALDQQEDAERVLLVAALPDGVAQSLRDVVWDEASDLRAAIVDLVVSAQRRIVLASPYWDAATTEELYPLLARRITAGVQVDLLGREVGGPTAGAAALDALAKRLGTTACRVTCWARPSGVDPFGLETFHFKVAIADGGARAYLGSANFTVSGMRSRMELGVVLAGAQAAALSRMVDAIIGP